MCKRLKLFPNIQSLITQLQNLKQQTPDMQRYEIQLHRFKYQNKHMKRNDEKDHEVPT